MIHAHEDDFEEQAGFVKTSKPVIVFNRIMAFVNFAKGMEIRERNKTLTDDDRGLLKKIEAVIDNHVSGNKVDDDILLCAGISGEAIDVPHSETQDGYIDKIMLDVMQAEGTLFSEQGTDFARTVAKRVIADECERCAKVCENLGMNAENERMCAYAIRNTGMV